ncbi:MAG TPA: acyl-ACP--UDP-N-acetylglucosamine O-acyltransferase [Opitutaceae bacterium]|jgi:UDP-N-acetylglucosamine acyltransferase|nr:acyl-ACP--UDP-N-acetylglucosamine O-acyltransferase [Opitutaceae bacterium]
MSAKIHPTALVEPKAELGRDVEIGPFAYVGGNVVLGDGTRLHHHASVEGNTVLGKNCEVYAYACLGGKTQDLKFKGGNPGLRIGDRNLFREYVTVHSGTKEDAMTVVGSDNVILAYCHIAHDCVFGSNNIMSNYTGLAGHVTVEDFVVFGAYAGIHQFSRIGSYSMLAAGTKLRHDMPPFFMGDGSPLVVRMINKVGLERNGFTSERLDRVKQIFRILYRDGLNRSQALDKLRVHPQAASAEFQHMLAFAEKTERGFAPGDD